MNTSKTTLALTVSKARGPITQAKLSRRADVSESLIARIERGEVKRITPRIASKLGTALKVDLSEYTNQ